METETISVSDVGQIAEQAVINEVAAVSQLAQDVADASIEQANERANAAHEMAAQVMEAALETERGRRIEALENRMDEIWHALESLRLSVSEMSERLTQVSVSQAATVATVLTDTLASTPAPSLTPIVSEQLEEAAEIAEVLPEAISQSDVAESPAPVIVRKARRLI